MIEAIYGFFADFALFIEALFTDFMEFFIDLFTLVIEAVLDGIATLIEAIPVPDFATTPLGSYIGADVAWLLSQSGFDTALAIIGAGIAFYFTRRILTVGIW